MKKFVMMICAVCLVFAGSGPASAILYNDHDYVVVTLPQASWQEAWDHMLLTLGQDYYLATITSQEEQNFIQNDLLGNLSGEYWLGGLQDEYYGGQQPGDDWNWVTGEAWNYTNWFNSEPNDNYGPGSEQYLTMWSNNGWQWNDESNVSNMSGYIAEKVVPEPGTLVLLGSGLLGLLALARKKCKK